MSLKDILGPAGESALLDGAYNVLHGAGAVLGATSSNGKPLPTANGLSKEIIATLGLKVADSTPLPYIWEAAIVKAGDEAALRRNIIEPRFTSCNPAPHHRHWATFPWKRMYTFNVDDVMPVAYGSEKAALQKLTTVHFDDDYRDTDPESDELQLVYLHGAASLPNLPLIFGPPAYASAATRQHTWWHVFADAFIYQPIIVVGATLREPDFEAYLSLKQRPAQLLKAPSLFVNTDIDDAIAATCARLGLIPVQRTAEAFLAELSTLVPHREKPSARRARAARSTALLATITSLPTLATVARQFVVVNNKAHLPEVEREPERFYEGYDPDWSDIKAGRDVERTFEAGVVGNAINFLTGDIPPAKRPTRPKIMILEGTAGTGKTTGLMRVASAIADRGISVLYFVATDRLRDEALVEVAATAKDPFVVVVDNFAESINQIKRFVEKYPQDAARCLVLGADRSAQRSFIQRHLEDVATADFEVLPRLTKAEALALAGKLRAAVKLGRFSGQTDSELAERFIGTADKDWAGQLLVILMEVVPGGTFRTRLLSEWKELPTSAEKTFYGSVCIAAACGVPLRSSLFFKTVGPQNSGLIFQSMKTGALRGLTVWERDVLKPRHRVVAEELISHCMSSDEMYDTALGLCSAISPYVSRATVMTRAPEARLARQMMDADGLVIPRISNRAESWFGQLERFYSWNSRFWEQRALVAMKSKRFARARDYAEQAIGLERHPLPMTTCARVWIDSAERDPALDQRRRVELLQSSANLLDAAIKLADARGRVEIHPYHILLELSVRASRKTLKSVPEWLRDMIRHHAKDALDRFANEPEIKRVLAGLQREGIL